MTTGQEMWLDPGPQLPRRTWQRKTRVPVIVGTTIVMVLFAAVAIGALLLGVLRTPTFTAKGGVVADCATEVAATRDGGQIARGAPVVVYDAAGGEAATTTLTGFLRSDIGCQLTFEADGVEYTDAGYVVRVGDEFSQPVSTAALHEGAVLRPLG